MNDHFRCKGCGASRSYVNQYCPQCESTGPHDPVGDKTFSNRQPKRKVAHKSALSDSDTFEPTLYLESRELRRKGRKSQRLPKSEANESSSADKDMRSILFKKSSGLGISRKTWRNLALAGFLLLAASIVVFNVYNILGGAVNQPPQQLSSGADKIPPGDADRHDVSSNVETRSGGKPVEVTGVAGNVTAANPPAIAGVPSTALSDTTPPKLTEQPRVFPNESSATISWKTNEKAVSQVNFGYSAGYQFQSAFTPKSSQDHSVYLDGLTADTTYHYQLISRDIAGNIMTSTDYTFRTEPVTDAAPYMGSKAPNFTLKKLDGKEVSLNQFRGKKVILNFWASWCSPCKIELPHFQAEWDKYSTSNDVMLLTVAGSQSDEDVLRSYMANNNFNFTVCLDSSDNVFNKYDLTSIPKTYFLDKSGVIHRVQQGMFTSPGEIEFMLNSY